MVACDNPSPEDYRHEDAVVEQIVYVPGQSCSGTGIDTNGDATFIDCSTDDTYAVVFRCPHGKFAIKKMPVAKRLWETLKAGDKVDVRYHVTHPLFGNVGHIVFDNATKE
jgi:hypothetical protein